MSLPRAYEDPHELGALGGVDPFAKAHQLKTPQAQRILQSVLSYTLRKPRRTRFPTTPTLVLDRDEQWQMDLVDMQKLSRWNTGHKYLLTATANAWTKRLNPQMSSWRSRTPQPETSSLQKRLFTVMDGRSVCGHARTSSSRGHLSTQRMGRHAYKRHVLRTRSTKSASIGRPVITGRKSLETQRTQRVSAVERVAVQVR